MKHIRKILIIGILIFTGITQVISTDKSNEELIKEFWKDFGEELLRGISGPFYVDSEKREYKKTLKEADNELMKGNFEKALSLYQWIFNNAHKAGDINRQIEMKYACSNNLGLCFDLMSNGKEIYIKSAIKYYFDAISFTTDPYYKMIPYGNISQLYYEVGDLDTALSYADVALGYSDNYWTRTYNRKGKLFHQWILSLKEMYQLKENFRKLKTFYEWEYYEEVTKLGRDILNKNYPVNLGFAAPSNRVERVYKGSFADLSGLLKGDVIKYIDKTYIFPTSFYQAYYASAKYYKSYGSSVIFKVLRDGRDVEINCKLIYPELDQTKDMVRIAKEKIKEGVGYKIEEPDKQKPKIVLLSPRSVSRGLKLLKNKNDIKENDIIYIKAGKSEIVFDILVGDDRSVKELIINSNYCDISSIDKIHKEMIFASDIKRYSAKFPIESNVDGDINKFDILVKDENNNTEQRTLFVKIESETASESNIIEEFDIIENKIENIDAKNFVKNQVAVVIGIDDYNINSSGVWNKLDGAVNDAKAIKSALSKIGYKVIEEIYNKEATQRRINQAIKDKINSILESNDSLIVYFAGHGDTYENQKLNIEIGHIIPIDGRTEIDKNGNKIYYNCITMEDIKDVINRYKNKYILFIFDSCYSGLLLDSESSGAKESILGNEIRYVITAGDKNEEALEDQETKHGVFTKHLITAISGNSDTNNDGIITVTEIANYLKPRVKRDADTLGHKQNPQSGYIKGDGVFFLEN